MYHYDLIMIGVVYGQNVIFWFYMLADSAEMNKGGIIHASA